MKLITKELEKKLKKAELRREDDPEILVKLFHPVGAATWCISSMEEDGDTMWGVADLGMGYVEYGTISLSELQNMPKIMGLGVERDLYINLDGIRVSDFMGMKRIDWSDVKRRAAERKVSSDA